MANISYEKNTAPNKHTVQKAIYKWISNNIKNKYPNILMLSGKYPEETLQLIKNQFSMAFIFAYERDQNIFNYIKTNTIDNLKKIAMPSLFELYNKDVMTAHNNYNIEDLDFCRTFLYKRRNDFNKIYNHDTIAQFQKRLLGMKHSQITAPKALIGTVSTRNGMGKEHTIKCLNSLCYVLGYTIETVDDLINDYSLGEFVPGSGCLHKNDGVYYAYEHKIKVKSLSNYVHDACTKMEIRMFTYTDTQPMLTFAIIFE